MIERRRVREEERHKTARGWQRIVEQLDPPIKVSEIIEIGGVEGRVVDSQVISRRFVGIIFKPFCLGCGVAIEQKAYATPQYHSRECYSQHAERRPRASRAKPPAEWTPRDLGASARAAHARIGLTQAEIRARAEERAHRLEAMWASGMTGAEIAAVEGWSRRSGCVAIANLRNEGYDFPRRQRKSGDAA